MKQKYSITVVGTLRKNKPEIPPPFIKSASAGTSRFAYADGMTLVSYCPKENKVVLLLSFYHKTGRIDSETEKPEIVIFYNKTKGGTNTFDFMCKYYSVARIKNRWPLHLFYDMLDQEGIDAAILYTLKKFSFDLIKPWLQVLIEDIPSSAPKSDKLDKRKRCGDCPLKDDRKTRYCCTSCRKAMCEEHRLAYYLDCAH